MEIHRPIRDREDHQLVPRDADPTPYIGVVGAFREFRMELAVDHQHWPRLRGKLDSLGGFWKLLGYHHLGAIVANVKDTVGHQEEVQ